jgi:hypothetical protein
VPRRLALAVIVAGGLLAGCGSAPVTGLSVTIRYQGSDIASIAVSGTVDDNGRAFGPYDLTTAALASGATVGLVFDPGDAGLVTVCADARDDSGRVLDTDCESMRVQANEVGEGSLSLRVR